MKILRMKIAGENKFNGAEEVNERREHILGDLSGKIKSLVLEKTADYKRAVRNLFLDFIETTNDDPLWKLLDYLEAETDFYTAPASTKYHSSEECGLVKHSLWVVANGLKFAPSFLEGDVDIYYLIISCLFHDFCKVNMYEQKWKDVRNDATGKWEKQSFYKFRDDYISYGHGIESMLRLNKFIAMPEAWNQAIRWHMGAYDISPMDKHAMEKALAKYREVLFLQTADMQAGSVEDI